MIIKGKEIKFGGQISIFEAVEENENEAISEVECKIISSKKSDDMTLTYKQIVTILEALYNFKEDIRKLKGNNEKEKAFYKFKIDEIDKLFSYLEKGIKYDFKKSINRCINSRIKQLNDEHGVETLSWLRDFKKEDKHE